MQNVTGSLEALQNLHVLTLSGAILIASAVCVLLAWTYYQAARSKLIQVGWSSNLGSLDIRNVGSLRVEKLDVYFFDAYESCVQAVQVQSIASGECISIARDQIPNVALVWVRYRVGRGMICFKFDGSHGGCHQEKRFPAVDTSLLKTEFPLELGAQHTFQNVSA